MSEPVETESLYPVYNSCSFLGINYYEETASKLDEYRTAALIPECCCLLNDVIYPLYDVDKFYWTPWKNVQYDAEFLSNETNKLEEKISNICANFSLFDEDENALFDEESLEIDNLFKDVNFKELKLQASFDSVNHYEFLEVPQIPNSFFQLKHEFPFNELLKSISSMESQNILIKGNNLTYDDLETPLECNSMDTDEEEILLEGLERFEEIILPMIPEKNVSFEHLSISSNKGDFLSNSGNGIHYKIIDFRNHIADSITLNNTERNVSDLHNDPSLLPASMKENKPLDDCIVLQDNFVFSSYEKHEQSLSVQEKNEPKPVLNKSSFFNYKSHIDIDEIEKYSSDCSDGDTCDENNKCHGENDNFSEIFNDDFFSENLMDFEVSYKGVVNQQLLPDSIFVDVNKLNSEIHDADVEKLNYSNNSAQSDDGKSFLGKLSKLDLIKVNEVLDNDGYRSKESKTDLKNFVKYSTAFRNPEFNQELKPNKKQDEANISTQTSVCQNPLVEKSKVTHNDLYEIQKKESFNLLSSFMCSRTKENGKIWSLEPSPSSSQKSGMSLNEKNEINLKNLKNLKDDDSSIIKENSLSSIQSVENRIQLVAEDIFVKLPEDYVQLILLYETAASFYIQKLVNWEGFKLSLNLTVIDISLDKTRFLLNQEVKNCQDQNISPLEGGVGYSRYIQLLILHGILKSLNSLINFGIQLGISCLLEYEKKHHSVLKDFFEDFIGKVNRFIENLSITNSVHPKMKNVGVYLQEKYYFCKENIIPFKVLIILKEHLNFFYSSFEAFMKILLPEIVVDLIPESCFLEQEADRFSGGNEYIYVACVSSVSKNILWKKLTLVIEYDTDNSVCWKAICNKENIAHTCVRFDYLPLKTLNEIKHLPPVKEPLYKSPVEVTPVPIIVSDTISSDYDLQCLLNEKQNILIYERSYKKFLPDMHFADVTIDYKTSVTVIHLLAFLNDTTSESFVDKIFNLYQKYEICWIIIYDNLVNKDLNKECYIKIQSNYFKFYYMTVTMKSFNSFKIKFLYAKSDEDIIKWISSIISKNLKYNLKKPECKPINNLSENMTKEELFLVSFPSLNPIVASFMLSSKTSLYQLMNLKLEDLHAKFQHVPERFLKHFLMLIQKRINLSPNPSIGIQGSMFGTSVKSDQIIRASKANLDPQILNSHTVELTNFISCLEKHYSTEEKLETNYLIENSEIGSQPCTSENEVPTHYSEMSLEEIDRNYRALKSQDMAYASFDVGFENNFGTNSIKSSSSSSSVSYTNDFSCRSIEASPGRQKNGSLVIQSDINNVYIKESQTCSLNELASSSDSYQSLKYFMTHNPKYNCNDSNTIRCTPSLYQEDKDLNSQKLGTQQLNISQYRYKKKRKTDSDALSQSKYMKYSSQNCSVLHTSPRLQKGQSSKTVCKQVSFKNISPMKSIEENENFYESSGTFQTLNNFSNKSDYACSEYIDSSWRPQDKITLTPRTNNILSYEKIPGKKGQTRLVFH